VVIASYVTSYARLELYNLLYKLEKRCLYYDTDSVIFTAKPGEYIPKTGQYLGQLTDEIDPKNTGKYYINKYVSIGPKCYAYSVANTENNEQKITCKTKGISINYTTQNDVNFDSMKKFIDDIINDNRQTSIDVAQSHIKVTKDYNVETVYNTKNFKLVYNKRKLLRDYYTLPFGYKN
jgi:hypothetical protein